MCAPTLRGAATWLATRRSDATARRPPARFALEDCSPPARAWIRARQVAARIFPPAPLRGAALLCTARPVTHPKMPCALRSRTAARDIVVGRHTGADDRRRSRSAWRTRRDIRCLTLLGHVFGSLLPHGTDRVSRQSHGRRLRRGNGGGRIVRHWRGGSHPSRWSAAAVAALRTRAQSAVLVLVPGVRGRSRSATFWRPR